MQQFADYSQRLDRVIDHIQANIDRDLSLDVLASVACFSKFHFHRLFRAFTGETLNLYVSRLRLERALNLIVKNPARTITQIALETGFSSSSNFTRLFQKTYGVSPSKVRKAALHEGRDALSLVGKKSEAPPRLSATRPRVGSPVFSPEHVAVISLPGLRVAYHRVHGGYSQPGITRAFKHLRRAAEEQGIFDGETKIIGIIYDDPFITPLRKCRYDACLSLPEGVSSLRGFNTLDLPGGPHAIYTFEGSPRDSPATWESLFTDWLLESRYEPDDRPGFDMFLGGIPKGPVVAGGACRSACR